MGLVTGGLTGLADAVLIAPVVTGGGHDQSFLGGLGLHTLIGEQLVAYVAFPVSLGAVLGASCGLGFMVGKLVVHHLDFPVALLPGIQINDLVHTGVVSEILAASVKGTLIVVCPTGFSTGSRLTVY